MDEAALNADEPQLSTQTLPQLLRHFYMHPDHIPNIEDEYALCLWRPTEPYTYDFLSFCVMMRSTSAVICCNIWVHHPSLHLSVHQTIHWSLHGTRPRHLHQSCNCLQRHPSFRDNPRLLYCKHTDSCPGSTWLYKTPLFPCTRHRSCVCIKEGNVQDWCCLSCKWGLIYLSNSSFPLYSCHEHHDFQFLCLSLPRFHLWKKRPHLQLWLPFLHLTTRTIFSYNLGHAAQRVKRHIQKYTRRGYTLKNTPKQLNRNHFRLCFRRRCRLQHYSENCLDFHINFGDPDDIINCPTPL